MPFDDPFGKMPLGSSIPTPQAFAGMGIAVPYDARGEVRTTCPQCSPSRRKHRDRCLSVNLDDGVFCCHHCGWSGRVEGKQTPGHPIERPTPQPNEKYRAALQRTWDEASPLTAGDPVTRYLASRGLCLPPNAWPPALRTHAALRYYDDEGAYRGTYPAMVARITDAAGKPASLHRTFLTTDGRKAPVPKVRKVMSAVLSGSTSGGGIRLYPPGEVLVICEGVETSLSVRLMTGLPVWAAGSAGAIGHLIVPPAVQLVVIAADHDRDPKVLALGAQKLAQRLAQEGRRAKILMPEQVGTDWNDVWQNATAERLTLARIEATPDVTLSPAPSTPDQAEDDPEARLGVRAHRLPDYLRDHPDPDVQRYWRRAYRQINAFKRAYLQDPYARLRPTRQEGATHDHN
jgi:putative DNA primase/helicase